MLSIDLLSPHSGYVKIDSYLLQFLYHVTSDIKFSHVFFFLIYIAVQSFILRRKSTLTGKLLEAFVHRCASK